MTSGGHSKHGQLYDGCARNEDCNTPAKKATPPSHLVGFVLLVERPDALTAVGHLVHAPVAIGVAAA